MKNRKTNKKGFTLVEVIVVLVILAILAAILVPTMIGWLNKANEKAAIAEARMILVAAQTIMTENYNSKQVQSPIQEDPNGQFTIKCTSEMFDEVLELAELKLENDVKNDMGDIITKYGKVASFKYPTDTVIVYYNSEATEKQDKGFTVEAK